MKLTLEQIAALEDTLTRRENGETLKEMSDRLKLPDSTLTMANCFFLGISAHGIPVNPTSYVRIPARDAAAFKEFLQRRRKANAADLDPPGCVAP